jgi:CHASE2 domain-containing sensor protein
MAIDHHTLSGATLILQWIIAFGWVLNIFALAVLGYGMGKYKVTPKLNLVAVLIVAIVLTVAARLVPGYLAWVCAIAGAFNALVAATSARTLMKEAKERR